MTKLFVIVFACFAFALVVIIKFLLLFCESKEKRLCRISNNYYLLKKLYSTEEEAIAKYIMDKGYKSIAIYGYGDIGRIFLQILIRNSMPVNYIIDRVPKEALYNVPVYQLSNELEKVDIVIVSLSQNYNSVINDLKKYGLHNSVLLSDILSKCDRVYK